MIPLRWLLAFVLLTSSTSRHVFRGTTSVKTFSDGHGYVMVDDSALARPSESLHHNASESHISSPPFHAYTIRRQETAPKLIVSDQKNESPSSCPLLQTVASKRVAVIIRGNFFRSGHDQDCAWADDEVRRRQNDATESLVEHVIEPLERCSFKLDVFAAAMTTTMMTDDSDDDDPKKKKKSSSSSSSSSSDHVPCEHAHQDLIATKIVAPGSPARHVVANHLVYGDGQGYSLRLAMELFKLRAPSRPNDYALIVFARYDFKFTTPISEWQNLDAFTFLSLCEPAKKAVPPHPRNLSSCANDIVVTTPGSLFECFDRAAGSGVCFNHPKNNNNNQAAHVQQHGHHCADAVYEQIKQIREEGVEEGEGSVGSSFEEAIRTLTPWVPPRSVHDASPLGVLNIYGGGGG
jgi:hypothetical protein